MSDLVVGFCRFSFLGRGDWARYKSVEGKTEKEIFAQVAKELYAPERMERRFATFEKITLPSIRYQTEKNFVFVVLASDAMPFKYKMRLRKICADVPVIRLVFADTTDVEAAIRPILQEFHESGDRIIQFRLDDDDAISRRYIELVYQHAARFKDLSVFALTFPKGLSTFCYSGEETRYTRFDWPFIGPSAIIKFANKRRSVFSVGHFAMKRFTHIQDTENFGTFVMKWDSASRRLDTNQLPSNFEPMDREVFIRDCEENFPGLEKVDFDAFRPAMPELIFAGKSGRA